MNLLAERYRDEAAIEERLKSLIAWREEADVALADAEATPFPSPDRGSLLQVAKLLERLAGTETVTSTGPK